MTVIAFVSAKGGSGKTTTAANCAVEARKSGHKVSIIDFDPQGSLSEWWQGRKDDDVDMIEGVEVDALASLKAKGSLPKDSLILMDTPPHNAKIIRGVVDVADYVVIPVQPSFLDLRAVRKNIAMCKQAGKPFAFVVNRANTRTNAYSSTLGALLNVSKVVGTLSNLEGFKQSMEDGLGVSEVKKKNRGAEEVKNLWAELEALI